MSKIFSYIWVLMIITGFLAGFYWNMGKLFASESSAQVFSPPIINEAPIIAEDNLGKILEKINKSDTKILFVGDLMLGRNVASLSKKYGADYPFANIKDFLAGFDFVSANLEGPIVKTPQVAPTNSMQFSFASQSAEVLKKNYIDLVSLANNHTLNMGQAGLKQTKEYLKEQGISFTGDPLKCGSELSYQKDNFVFLSFNQTFSFVCKDADFIATTKKIRLDNPDKFLVINVHWGKEYQLTNTATQKNLAHALIDAGADLIIGHHPHVVENIELYKNKLIFYSLGNFIFDQYFNENVQQGLAIDLEINKTEFIYKLYPLISKKSQPAVMEEKDANKFLVALATISGKDLIDEIKLGQIILKKDK
jgi:poly-gamma-glutamate synthesis protein (capsule biosynthesis protein)